MKSGIYCLRNRVNGKVYVGSAINMVRRRAEHFWELRGQQHYNRYLQRAYNKYGEGSFEFTVLEESLVVTQLIPREQYWIDYYDSANPIKGYNVCPVAGSNLGLKFGPRPEAAKEKQHIAMLGNKNALGKNLGNKNGAGNRGKKHPPRSPESRERYRVAKLGWKPTPEQVEKSRIAMLGRRNALGNKHTLEFREKKRTSMLGNRYALGHVCSPETREKQRVGNVGKKRKKIERAL